MTIQVPFSEFALDRRRTLPSSNNWPRDLVIKETNNPEASQAACGWALFSSYRNRGGRFLLP
jgi:hypothetical protein